jgi:hypothetical protein
MSFAFGAPPSENPDGGGGDDPSRDEKDKKIEELERQLSKMKLKFQDVKKTNAELTIELEQTKELLGNIQAPTIFNQLQVIASIIFQILSFLTFLLMFRKLERRSLIVILRSIRNGVPPRLDFVPGLICRLRIVVCSMLSPNKSTTTP